MATRRDWLATQFEVTENDKASVGLVASTLAMGIDTIEGMLMSDNLFLRKLGKKAQELDNATLPEHLVSEKADWEKAIAETEKALLAKRKANNTALGKKEKALLATKLFDKAQVIAMVDALVGQFEQGQSEIHNRVAQGKERLSEIALYPVNTINGEFLDKFAKVVVSGNGNGTREPVEGKVWKVNLDGVFFYVAIESGDKYRIYDSAHTMIKDNTDFPGERITSRTRAKKVIYIGHYKGWESVTGMTWGKVKSGGVAGTEEHSTVENFVIA